jgi:hypothetical protein
MVSVCPGDWGLWWKMLLKWNKGNTFDDVIIFHVICVTWETLHTA